MASPEFLRKLQQTRGCPHTPEGAEELDAVLGEYVMVSKEDAVAAMASYIAAWLSTVPEAKNMEPAQLQGAILGSIKARCPLPDILARSSRAAALPSAASHTAARAR